MIGWLRQRKSLIVLAVSCATGGAAVSWWLNQPIPPWISFPELRATYERGSKTVDVSGIYTARKTCSRDEQDVRPGEHNPLVWRQEVQGTGPEIIQYAPSPAPPKLERGTHPFYTFIPLTEGIEPDGWQVSILVTCANEPAIRSHQTKVEYRPARENSHGD
jgi:hypothetical protein